MDDGTVMCQSKAAARAVAIKLGYYSSDPNTIHAIDAILDFNQENHSDILGYAFAPERTPEGNQKWLDGWQKKGDILEARLVGHGKQFVAGTDKPTLADFSVAGSYWGQYYNEQSVWKGELHDGLAKIIETHPNLKRYLETTMKKELANYEAKREVYPF